MGRGRAACTSAVGAGDEAAATVVSTGGDAAAAAELRRLLLGVEEYRLRWLRHVQRRRNGTISHSAVARVLSSADPTGASLESLRDRSRRALRGEVLTPPTLRLFSEAFGFTLAEQERLWTLLGNTPSTEASRTSDGDDAPPVVLLSHAVDVLVGADGRSWTVRTTLTVQALADDVAHLPLGPGRSGSAAQCGPTALLGCAIEVDAGHALARFPRALRAGDLHVLAYEAAGGAMACGYDVVLTGPTGLLAVQVGFTPPALPARVWWHRSPDPAAADAPAEQEVLPGPSHRVSWTQQDLAPGRYGFTWTW